MHRYFIDESGHSGDLIVRTGDDFDFDGQPFFTLAAVGVRDLPMLEEGVASLRSKHRIAPGELKAKSLQSKPAFVAELLSLMLGQKCQLFVEVVDKRYFFCTHIVNIILLRAELKFDNPHAEWLWQNMAADWMFERMSAHVLTRFVDACRSPSDHVLMSLFGSLMLTTGMNLPDKNSEFTVYMQDLIVDTIKAYGNEREKDASAYFKFLPIPDRSKKDKNIWLLPNLTCLTNLYARINLHHGRRIGGITLVHDNQSHFDEILRSAKDLAEGIDSAAFTPYSDYSFIESSILEFANSSGNVGIECADVLAGTVMRYFRDMRSGEHASSEVSTVVRALLDGLDARDGYGINQVVASKMVLRGS